MMRSAMLTNVRPGDWSDLIYVKTAGLFRGPSAAGTLQPGCVAGPGGGPVSHNQAAIHLKATDTQLFILARRRRRLGGAIVIAGLK